MVTESAGLDREENVARLDTLDVSYRKLGGRYARFADELVGRRERLLDEARRDIEDFALLIEVWEPLIEAARVLGLAGTHAPGPASAEPGSGPAGGPVGLDRKPG
jgi:hypothetical protein